MPTSTLRSSTPISTASPPRRLPMPWLPAARRSSLPRGIWRRARALSGPADADEAVPDGWAQANAAERARIAVVSSSFRVGDTWGREKGRREAEISAPLAFLEDQEPEPAVKLPPCIG